MTDQKNVIVVQGTIYDKQDSKNFHEILSKPEFFKILTTPARVRQKDDVYHITLYVEASAESFVRESLRSGALRPWGDRFEIQTTPQ